MFRFTHVRLQNFRCFEDLSLTLEPDLTVLFAENGEGKSAILNALALGLSVFQPRTPRELKLDWLSDIRMLAMPGQQSPEPVGPCTLTWRAEYRDPLSGSWSAVDWSSGVDHRSGRLSKSHSAVLRALEQVRVRGERWPLFAWYGTERMGRGRKPQAQAEISRDRWEGYAASLDDSLDDGPLLEWMLEELLTDAVRRQKGDPDDPERFLVQAVLDTLVKATPGVVSAWYDPRRKSPFLRFRNGGVSGWRQLSDGYHVFLALVADLARRAILLNPQDGGEAPERLEGVVLIDELDLHLHPRWQRRVIRGLQEVFPRLQLIVTTHSPQLLSSVKNRQVRWLVEGGVRLDGVRVEGRDSNAILRDLMNTDDRDEQGTRLLRELYEALENDERETAQALLTQLNTLWGSLDPEVIRATEFLSWED